LSADDWDTQMLYVLEKGYRVIAHDRRGHGRSTQVGTGHDMDHYAADVAELVAHLDLQDAIPIGHSIMVKTPTDPGGLPIEVFDGLRSQLAVNRAQFYLTIASGPFLHRQPAVREAVTGLIERWHEGMMGPRQSTLRRHKGFLGDGLHRGPEDHRFRERI
jgi:non-heme chloroperoxidase